MTDPATGFMQPTRNGPLVLRGMVPSDDDAVLAKAAEKLSPPVVTPPTRGWSGTVTQTWKDGRLIGIRATEARG